MEPVLFSYEARLIRVAQSRRCQCARSIFLTFFRFEFRIFFPHVNFFRERQLPFLNFQERSPAITPLLPDSFTSAILDQNENELHSHRVYSSILGGFRIVRSLYGASLPDRETCDEWNCNMQPEQRCDGIGFVSLATRSSDVPGATAAPQSAAQM